MNFQYANLYSFIINICFKTFIYKYVGINLKEKNQKTFIRIV